MDEKLRLQISKCLEERILGALSKNDKRWAPKPRQRINEFVMLPVIPTIAAELTSNHMALDHANLLLADEIIQFSLTTVNFLRQFRHRIVPFPLFFSTSTSSRFHPVRYLSNILWDRQCKKIVFHIIGHTYLNSDRLSIGESVTTEWNPEDMAKYIAPMLSQIITKLEQSHVHTIELVLHFCQSAAFEPHHVDLDSVATTSYAGRLFIAVSELVVGLDCMKLKVFGFAGFYESMANGSGIRICDINNVDVGKYERCMYVVESSGARLATSKELF